MGDSRERPAFTRQGRRPAGAHNPGKPGSTPGPGIAGRSGERMRRKGLSWQRCQLSNSILGIG